MHDVSGLISLLRAHWVFHLASIDPRSDAPYSTPLYYAAQLAEATTRSDDRGASRDFANLGSTFTPLLVFFSHPHSFHTQLQKAQPSASASIALETSDIHQIRGTQLRGRVHTQSELSPSLLQTARETYLARHPQAAPHLQTSGALLYAFAIEWAKLTDNRLGFGVHPQFTFPPLAPERNLR